jgi:ribosome modulation factor
MTKKTKDRDSFLPLTPAMHEAREKGRKAFREGLGVDACPYTRTDPMRDEWHLGYEKAQSDKERDDEKFR